MKIEVEIVPGLLSYHIWMTTPTGRHWLGRYESREEAEEIVRVVMEACGLVGEGMSA